MGVLIKKEIYKERKIILDGLFLIFFFAFKNGYPYKFEDTYYIILLFQKST